MKIDIILFIFISRTVLPMYCEGLGIRRAGGVHMHGVVMPYVARTQQQKATHEIYKFVPDTRHLQYPQSTCRRTAPNDHGAEQGNGPVMPGGERLGHEDDEDAKEETLAEYASACKTMAALITNRVESSMSNPKPIVNGEIHMTNVGETKVFLDKKRSSEKIYIPEDNDRERWTSTFSDAKKHSFLGKLREMTELSKTEKCTKPSSEEVDSQSLDLRSDILLSNLQQTEFLKPCLDIVCSNVSVKNVRALEIGKIGLSKKCKYLLPPFLSMTNCVATRDADVIEQLSDTAPDVEIIDWSPANGKSKSMTQFNLVCADNVLRKQENLKTALQGVADILSDGGFLLIQEVTSDFKMATLLDAMNSADNKAATHSVDARSQGFYCDTVKWRKLFSESGFELICEVKDAMLMSLFLLRKRNANSVEKQTFLELMKGETFDWLSELKVKVEDVSRRPKGENLWLVSDDSSSGILGMVNCLRNEPGGEKLR